ncbi:porin family protein [Bacteroides sp. 519]|uniref:porin family protein n=1 Tax=Bacteroides sp. 519 TaxID=2302937 RepID=UPI0013D08B4B|nr:porin family protein [Bacteroides sp. 519]NDV60071.1 PorT family protein [Bacteroides sp. 519]
MKQTLFICILIIVSIHSAFAQSEQSRIERINNKTVNFGFRAGFNSAMYLVSNLNISGVTIDDIQNTYRIGYTGSAFMRLNFLKHYLQPEISYQISQSEITFDKLGSQNPEIQPDYATITSKIHSFEVPVLYGYNIVKKGPYGLSVFGGPKIKYLSNNHNKITFENFDQKNVEEELHPITVSLTIGIAVNISNIFFDFRYEQGLHNISKSVTYDNIVHQNKEIVFKRRDNILSFSLGIIL